MPIENQILVLLTERIRQIWSHDYRTNYERGERYLRDWSSTDDLRGKEFFAVTLTPRAKVIYAKGIWTNLDARERYVMGLWKKLKHQLNRKLHNNYQRHPELALKDLSFIEHRPSNPNINNLIIPHLHGTISVDGSLIDHLYEVLTPITTDAYQIDTDTLKNGANGIRDCLVKPLSTKEDIILWMGYASKQFDMETT